MGRKYNLGQPATLTEGIFFDDLYAVGEHDPFQRLAPFKRMGTNVYQAVGQRDVFQGLASAKGIFGNVGNGGGNDNLLYWFTAVEGIGDKSIRQFSGNVSRSTVIEYVVLSESSKLTAPKSPK